ncbi:MAG: peptidase dimerization domain-containing protein, partial [Actinomycetota bacterium]|nr:peptidase dimerization domain-containing protein [Actinomycetota bacterium]
PSGAQLLVQEGILEGAVRAIVGAHVQPDLPWGSLSIGQWADQRGMRNVQISVEGQAAHNAYPHLGRDPILAISSIIVGLHTLVSCRLDPSHPAVLIVGQVHSGTANNVVPARATASLTVRTCGSGERAFFGVVAPIAMGLAGPSGAPGFDAPPLHHPEFLPPDEAVASVARAQAVLYLAAAPG